MTLVQALATATLRAVPLSVGTALRSASDFHIQDHGAAGRVVLYGQCFLQLLQVLHSAAAGLHPRRALHALGDCTQLSPSPLLPIRPLRSGAEVPSTHLDWPPALSLQLTYIASKSSMSAFSLTALGTGCTPAPIDAVVRVPA